MENKELELIKEIENSVENKVKSELQNVKSSIEGLEKNTNELKEALVKQGEMLLEKTAKKISGKKEFEKSLTDIAGKIKAGATGFHAIEVEKVAALMSEATNITGEVPQSDRIPGINNVVKQVTVLRNFANVGGTNSNLVSWVEQQNIDGAAAITAEGNAKPLVDWDYVEATANVRKIAGRVRISTEMLSDIPNMMAEINGDLLYRLALAEETQLLSGAGGAQLNGVTTYAQPLDLAALADSVEAANDIDAIGAAITQIYVNGKGMFIPNVIFLNPVDAFKLKSVKNNDESYVMPVYIMPDGMRIMGIQVIETVTITAGNFLVADMRYFNIRDKETTRIEIGRDADDFSKNMVTIIAEKRLATFVKANDVEAFVYESFTDAKNFINKAS